MVHDVPAAMLPTQLFVCVNGPGSDTFETCSGPVPVLCSVMFLAVLVVPTTCDENERLVGVTEAPGAVPVPFSSTTCVGPRFPESSLTFKAPVVEPTTDGANVTETLQFDPGSSVPRCLSSKISQFTTRKSSKHGVITTWPFVTGMRFPRCSS